MTRRRLAPAVWASIAAIAVLMSSTLMAADEKKEEAGKEGAKKEDVAKADPKSAETYSAVVLPSDARGNITPSEITIKIDRFTTPEEREHLRGILEKDGQSAAMTEAQKHPIGRIFRVGAGVDILYAAKEATDKGDRIMLVSRRGPIFQNTAMNADSMDLPFSILWFSPAEGKGGEGKVVGAARLLINPDGRVNIQAYQASAAKLAFVKPSKK